MSEPLIRVQDLTVGWDRNVLLRSVSFDVERGDVFVILGSSGCGKSTLLRYLIGLEAPLAGTISIKGLGSPRLEGARPEYGVMFQSGALFSSMTVGENVGFALQEWTGLPPDAVNAIVKAKLTMPDLILMDVVMPGLNGFQATRAISRDADTKHIPIVLCTSKNQETDKIWGMRQGARDYVVKPVDKNELLAKISALS